MNKVRSDIKKTRGKNLFNWHSFLFFFFLHLSSPKMLQSFSGYPGFFIYFFIFLNAGFWLNKSESMAGQRKRGQGNSRFQRSPPQFGSNLAGKNTGCLLCAIIQALSKLPPIIAIRLPSCQWLSLSHSTPPSPSPIIYAHFCSIRARLKHEDC